MSLDCYCCFERTMPLKLCIIEASVTRILGVKVLIIETLFGFSEVGEYEFWLFLGFFFARCCRRCSLPIRTVSMAFSRTGCIPRSCCVATLTGNLM